MKLPLVGDASRGPTDSTRPIDVEVAVTGAMDDAVALDFARALSEAMGATLWREGQRPEGAVVATGLALTRRARARLHVVISGGVGRSAWREPRLRCDLELGDPRLAVARGLGEHLARSKQEW